MPADAGASEASAPVASASAGASDEDDGDEVRPVYPVDHLPPEPLAARYCDAVQDTPRRRRDACCPAIPAFATTSECTRTLSVALRSGAVTLDAGAVEACAAAVVAATTGCDWVASTGGASADVCLGIIRGTRTEGASCRSSLECGAGTRCRGLSATHTGRCAPPLQRGVCNIGTDSLATFTRQTDVEREHPECEGYCASRQCTEGVRGGGACTASVQCGPHAWCAGGKCAAGDRPKPGMVCTDVCAPGARCAGGLCVAMKAEGEACAADGECRAHCAKDDGGGHCAADCPSLPRPTK